MAVLGPGTGLGVACFVPGSPSASHCERGRSRDHGRDLRAGRRESSPICAGSSATSRRSGSISGAGLENLYRAVGALDAIDAPPRNAAEITKAALDGNCPVASMALDLFCAMLGTIAGNAALMFGARGGVYIAGGSRRASRTSWRARNSARASSTKAGCEVTSKSIPSSIIMHPAATFLGLRSIAKRHSEAAPTPASAQRHRQTGPPGQPIVSAGNGTRWLADAFAKSAVERWSWRKNASAFSPAAATFPASTRSSRPSPTAAARTTSRSSACAAAGKRSRT